MSESGEDASLVPPPALIEVFASDCVATIESGAGKADVLGRLVQLLADAGKLPQQAVEPVVESLVERERQGTTGMGRGVAIPHAKTDAVGRSVGAIGLAADGIDFDSLDGQPTRLVLLVLSPPSQHREHGAVLASLARLFCDRSLQFQEELPQTPEELLQLLE